MSYDRAVWSWTEHLRAAGTTSWRDWVASRAYVDAGPVPPGWSVPGAAQLELLRRIWQTGTVDTAAAADLSRLVLARSGPGRGLGQQPLLWEGDGAPGPLGAPAVDPADVPEDELVRIGVGALTEVVLRASASASASAGAPPRHRPFSRSFRLVGAPVTTAVVRRRLARAGHVEGGHRPRVVVLAEPLDVALGQVWSARVQSGAPVRWRGFAARTAARSALPPSVDYPALAGLWAERVGSAEVHVVVAPPDPVAATLTAASLLGVGLAPPRRWHHRRDAPGRDPLPLSPEAVDLLRRVNAVLNVRADDDEHDRAGRLLATVLSERSPEGHLALPGGLREWTGGRARRVADLVRAGGYPVHGDLGRLAPRSSAGPTRPRRDRVLALTCAACLALAGGAGGPGPDVSRT